MCIRDRRKVAHIIGQTIQCALNAVLLLEVAVLVRLFQGFAARFRYLQSMIDSATPHQLNQMTTAPVSYTHRGVYKRQIITFDCVMPRNIVVKVYLEKVATPDELTAAKTSLKNELTTAYQAYRCV